MDNQDKDTDQISNGIGAMLDSLPFRVGSMKSAKAQAGPLLEHKPEAAELCQDDFMCVAAGYSMPGDKLLKQFKIPEQIAR